MRYWPRNKPRFCSQQRLRKCEYFCRNTGSAGYIVEARVERGIVESTRVNEDNIKQRREFTILQFLVSSVSSR